MISFPHLADIVRKNDAKIIMLVISGMGSAPDPVLGRTELEAARIPNLDHIAQQSSGGLTIPVSPGIAPGGVGSNLALLGYDPIIHASGRGAIEALGLGMTMESGDVALHGNLAVVDSDGIVVDRRAGAIPTTTAAPLMAKLKAITLPGVDVEVVAGVGHRFSVRLRGKELTGGASDTDPYEDRLAAQSSSATAKGGEATADAINAFSNQAAEALVGEALANAVLLRGASTMPELASFNDSYALNAAGISSFPLYVGVAKATGMTTYPVDDAFESHITAIREHWDDHDFFWLHYREPSTTAGIRDFNEKKRALERVDLHVRELIDLQPDVLVIAGDVSNPPGSIGHSWHAVPFVIRSAGTFADSGVVRFNERDLRSGSLGQFEAKHAMMLTLAHAGKLKQFGA